MYQNLNDKHNKPLQAFVVFTFKMYYRPLHPGTRNHSGFLVTHDNALY